MLLYEYICVYVCTIWQKNKTFYINQLTYKIDSFSYVSNIMKQYFYLPSFNWYMYNLCDTLFEYYIQWIGYKCRKTINIEYFWRFGQIKIDNISFSFVFFCFVMAAISIVFDHLTKWYYTIYVGALFLILPVYKGKKAFQSEELLRKKNPYGNKRYLYTMINYVIFVWFMRSRSFYFVNKT